MSQPEVEDEGRKASHAAKLHIYSLSHYSYAESFGEKKITKLMSEFILCLPYSAVLGCSHFLNQFSLQLIHTTSTIILQFRSAFSYL